ncbi:RNA polymerase sigma factor [Streptomyces collinus]|uniref:RNA polymerase sigma factor n=1 Tax=Streptomyces collinus TaxID=42684 RepID=UPI0033EADD78
MAHDLPAPASQRTESLQHLQQRGPLPQSLPRDDFEAFYVTEKKHAISFLIYIGAMPWEADDLAHEALMKLLPDQWATINFPRTWLRRVTSRAYWKQHQRSREDVTDTLPDLPGGVCPVTEVVLTQQANAILEAVRQLPAVQRTVMAFVLNDADTAEIAETLNMSQDAVRANVSRARRKLKAALGIAEGETNA